MFGLNLRRLVPLRSHVSSLPLVFCSLQPFETSFCLILFLVGFLLFHNYVIDVQTVQSCHVWKECWQGVLADNDSHVWK